MYFRKSNIGSHKLGVQEANVSVSQFHRIGIYVFGCFSANGWNSCSPSMGCGDRSIAFFEEHPSSSERSTVEKRRWMIKCRDVEHEEKSGAQIPKTS